MEKLEVWTKFHFTYLSPKLHLYTPTDHLFHVLQHLSYILSMSDNLWTKHCKENNFINYIFVKNSESEELFHINFTLKILLYYLKNIHQWWHFCFLSFAGDYFNSNICDRIHHTTMGSRLSQCLCRNKRKIMVCCKAIFYYRCVTEVNILSRCWSICVGKKKLFYCSIIITCTTALCNSQQ